MKTLVTARDFLEMASARLSQLCLAVASLALVLLIGSFGWLVFGRYVLNTTPTWVEQLALLLICYITFLGAAVGVKEDTHLGVTLFRDMLPVGLNQIVLLFCDIALAIFGTVMCLSSIELVRFGWPTLLPMLNLPEGVRSLSAALCGGLIALFCAIRVLSRAVQLIEQSASGREH